METFLAKKKPVVNEPPREAETAAVAGPASFEQVSAGKWLAERSGFKQGVICTSKNFQIILFEMPKFTERSLGMWEPHTVHTSIGDLKLDWSVYKGTNLPTRIVGTLTAFECPKRVPAYIARA